MRIFFKSTQIYVIYFTFQTRIEFELQIEGLPFQVVFTQNIFSGAEFNRNKNKALEVVMTELGKALPVLTFSSLVAPVPTRPGQVDFP